MTRINPATVRMVGATVLTVILSGAAALATPSFGTSQSTLASSLHTTFDVDAKRPDWKGSLKVKGVSDVVVTSHSVIPGGYSGWHSHPCLSIVSVSHGAVWLYDAADPT